MLRMKKSSDLPLRLFAKNGGNKVNDKVATPISKQAAFDSAQALLEEYRADLEAVELQLGLAQAARENALPGQVGERVEQLARAERVVKEKKAEVKAAEDLAEHAHEAWLAEQRVESDAQASQENLSTLAEFDSTKAEYDTAIARAGDALLRLAAISATLDAQARAAAMHPGARITGRDFDWSFPAVWPPAGMGLSETYHWCPPGGEFRRKIRGALKR